MSPVYFSCVICGYLIGGYTTSATVSWLREFRAIYSSPEGSFVSGVGQYDDPDGTWIAPSDPTMRWDDHDYLFQETDVIPVMQQPPENGRHGFVLHDACWDLLRKAFEPDNVPIERLLQICRSLPFPLRGIGVCWGHDYGGLTLFDNQGHYPWEDRLMEPYKSETYQYAKANPCAVPEMFELLTTASQMPPDLVLERPGQDCFSMLPWEILEAIAVNLRTGDALSLCRSSRSFLPLLTSQTFWASRFEAGRDRDFIFEARNKRESRDWIGLYRLTSRVHSSPALNNRRRIWALISQLKKFLYLSLDDRFGPSRANLSTDSLIWNEVAGDVNPEPIPGYYSRFYEGCRLFQKQCASIPSDLSKMAFSIIASGDVKYVAGMRLISSEGEDICLGYIADGSELFLEVTEVKGFVLAMGSPGIRALQVINGNGHVSRWFGCPKDAPVTERLAQFESIGALEVGLDGYKMVSLSVAGLTVFQLSTPLAQEPSLRTTALWYPEVPGLDLRLNDESFTGENPSASGYQPLFWTRFGGPNGIYLQHLTDVRLIQLGNICSIEFNYDREYIQKEVGKLGRRPFTNFTRVTQFPIDGPGGEFIQTVDVSTERAGGESAFSFYRHGKLSSLKITTNRGRSIHLQPGAGPPGMFTYSPLAPLSIAPGTTLTGLYASQHPEAGLVSLGAISEVVEIGKSK